MTRTFKLARLYSGWEKDPILFARYYNDAMDEIEETLNQLLSIPVIEQALEDLEDATDLALADVTAATVAAQAAADNAQDAAEAAQDAAEAAQDVANNAESESAVVNSYIAVGSFTAPLISVDDAGLVTIADHDRVLGTGETISVTGSTVTTVGVENDVIRIYYDSTERTDLATITPTFTHTIDPTAPLVQGGDTFSVGAVTVPGIGATNEGVYVTPPGFVEP